MVHIRNIRRKLKKEWRILYPEYLGKGVTVSTKKRSIWKNRLTLEGCLRMCAAALLIAIAAANLTRNIAVDWIYNVVYFR